MDYRYKLEPHKSGHVTRYPCPRCQQKKFSHYIDSATGERLHPTVGRCNREDSCQYHYPPRMFFQDNNIQHDRRMPTIRKPKPLPKAISFIAEDVFLSSQKQYEFNNFVQWLRKLFGDDITNELVEKYGIGTSKHWTGATVFWLIDIELKIRSGEIIHFDAETGRTIKEPQRRKYWVHSALKQPDFNLQQCFFGEHLLTIQESHNKPIAIVEAAKTAIIASVFFPQYIWLACLGKNGLNADKFKVLKGRTVVLYPDVNAFDYWDEKAREFSHIATVEVSSLLEKIATPDERKSGWDIADYLLREPYSKPNIPSPIEVVHVRKNKDFVYIGNEFAEFEQSKWGNPHPWKKYGREKAIRLYREWITEGDGKHLLNDLHELRGKKLGCWCKPDACHGDILKELAEQPTITSIQLSN